MNLLEEVSLLNLEDRGEVWRRRIRWEWWERKITQRGFWTDWIKERKENEFAVVEVPWHWGRRRGDGDDNDFRDYKSITLNDPYSFQVTFTFILSLFSPHNALGVNRGGKQVRIHPKSSQYQNWDREDVKYQVSNYRFPFYVKEERSYEIFHKLEQHEAKKQLIAFFNKSENPFSVRENRY